MRVFPRSCVAFLAVALFLTSRNARAVEPDPLLPADCQLVVGLRVRQLAEAALFKTHLAPLVKEIKPSENYLTLVLGALNIDPWTDIDVALLAGPALPEGDKTLLIFRGRFDLAKRKGADALAKDRLVSVRVHKEGERLVYEFKPKEADGSPAYLCFLDKETVVAARARALISEAIARADAKKPAPLAKPMLDLLAGVDGKATAWIAALATEPLKESLSGSGEAQRIADALQTMRGSVTVGDSLSVDGVIQSTNAKAAAEIRKFAEGVKGILILAAMNRDKQWGPVGADLLGTLKIANDKGTVSVKGQVTGEQIDKSIAAAKKKE